MNVLITGGTGYLGAELVQTLAKRPEVKEIVVFDNLSNRNYRFFLGGRKPNAEKIRFVKGNILDSVKLRTEVDRANIVYHLAAKVTTPFADHNPHEFDQVNNWGTSELTYLVEKSHVLKLIYTSSASVYGVSDEVIDMTTSPNPITFYGVSKLNGEAHVSRLFNSETETFILRLGNVYGHGTSMRFDSVINKFMFEANFLGRVRIIGSGDQQRSFIHIDKATSILEEVGLGAIKPNTYDLVETIASINEIVDELKALYPELEMTFVNQNMKMRSLIVKPDQRLSKLNNLDEDRLSNNLRKFKESFSF